MQNIKITPTNGNSVVSLCSCQKSPGQISAVCEQDASALHFTVENTNKQTAVERFLLWFLLWSLSVNWNMLQPPEHVIEDEWIIQLLEEVQGAEVLCRHSCMCPARDRWLSPRGRVSDSTSQLSLDTSFLFSLSTSTRLSSNSTTTWWKQEVEVFSLNLAHVAHVFSGDVILFLTKLIFY